MFFIFTKYIPNPDFRLQSIVLLLLVVVSELRREEHIVEGIYRFSSQIIYGLMRLIGSRKIIEQ